MSGASLGSKYHVEIGAQLQGNPVLPAASGRLYEAHGLAGQMPLPWMKPPYVWSTYCPTMRAANMPPNKMTDSTCRTPSSPCFTLLSAVSMLSASEHSSGP